MKSSIKINFADNGKGLQPVIKVLLISSDDPRDKLIQTFFGQLGGDSSWLSVVFDGYTGGNECPLNSYISIYPICKDELKETMDIIKNRIIESPKCSYALNSSTLIQQKEPLDL